MEHNLTDPRRAKALSRRALWKVMPLAGFLGLVAYLDRVSIAYAGPQGMNEALGLSATAFGWAVGLFTVGYILFEVPSSGFAEKMGARRWIVRVLITWGIIQSLIAFVPNAELLYVGRFLLGVAEAGFTPAIYLYISGWLVRAYRPLAFSIYAAIVTLTAVVGPIISTSVITVGDALTGAFEGWRWLLLILGVFALVAAIPAHFHIKERVEEVTWLTDSEKNEYREMLRADEQSSNAPRLSMSQVIRNYRPWMLGFGFFAITYASFTVVVWTPTIVLGFQQQFDTTFNVFQSALIAGIPTLVGLPLALAMAFLAGRTGKTGWFIAGAAIAGAIGCFITTVADSPAVLIGALCLVSFAGSSSILFMSMVTRLLTGPGAFAAIAIVNSVGATSSLISPVVTGYLNDLTGHINAGFYLVCGLLVAGALIAILAQRVAQSTQNAEATVAAVVAEPATRDH